MVRNLLIISIIYSIAVTGLWLTQSQRSVQQYVTDNGEEISKWAFGKDWYNTKVSEAVGLWNKRHPKGAIRADETVKDAVKEVGMAVMTRRDVDWNYFLTK